MQYSCTPRAALFLLISMGAAESRLCESWCSWPCAELNGNVRNECAGCGPDFECRPGAAGFNEAQPPQRPAEQVGQRPTAAERVELRQAADGSLRQSSSRVGREYRVDTTPLDAPLSEAAVAASEALARTEEAPCQRVEGSQIADYSAAQLATLFARPTIITGSIEHWPAHERWRANLSAFAERFGHHEVLSRRGNFARERVEQAGGDPALVGVPLGEFEAAVGGEHMVLYNGEGGQSDAEKALLGELRRGFGYDVPHVLERASGVQVFSFGGGTGVRMANHGFAWIGLVAGAKLWHVAPPEAPKPEDPRCWPRDAVEALGPRVTHCLQREREVMVVPTGWWHATCNLAPYTLGIGGQDSCDLTHCDDWTDEKCASMCDTGADVEQPGVGSTSGFSTRPSLNPLCAQVCAKWGGKFCAHGAARSEKCFRDASQPLAHGNHGPAFQRKRAMEAEQRAAAALARG